MLFNRGAYQHKVAGASRSGRGGGRRAGRHMRMAAKRKERAGSGGGGSGTHTGRHLVAGGDGKKSRGTRAHGAGKQWETSDASGRRRGKKDERGRDRWMDLSVAGVRRPSHACMRHPRTPILTAAAALYLLFDKQWCCPSAIHVKQ